jgi:hypothetical protein
MIKKILNSIWDFLIDLGEYRYEVIKSYGFQAWY